MAAITFDTGWMKFANTNSRCLRAVGLCLDKGVRPDILFRKLYQQERPERLALTVRALESLELFSGGLLATMTIRKRDFQETGAVSSETENIVNEALRLATVETSILLTENEGYVRVSLRSRDAVNVAEVAARFGGGGHARAAGVRSELPVDELKQQLVAECQKGLRQVGLIE